MVRVYEVITFDCYRTLIDWEAGLNAALAEAAAADGFPLSPGAAAPAYVKHEPAVEAEPYRSYRAVLAETAMRAATSLGWRMSEERARILPDSLPDWPPFPDTNPALERLAAAGHTLGILSNVDDDLLAGTLRHLTVRFEILVTAEQVRSYKPASGHFDAARRRIGGGRWLHAAQSYFHDVTPARALGIPVAWINRRGEAPAGDARPDREFRTLTELAVWLTDGES
jgi:2-haloacid dehalogenase/putative hydrolase of the HAD superfamily